MDDNLTKKSIINIDIPKSVENAIKNITDKPTSTIGEIISDCLYLVFGGINRKADLMRVKHAHDLEQFKEDLEEKINDVPENKRVDANFQVVYTAIDNMRFCLEEEQLRKMFSSLIANSINADKTDYIHPSYGEIIKQMTSLDASIFLWMSNQQILPMIKVKIQDISNKSMYYISKRLMYKDWGSVDRVASSLDNLERLKLIDITFESYYTDDNVYEQLKKCSHIASIIKDFESKKGDKNEISFGKGFVKITEYGQNFLKACT